MSFTRPVRPLSGAGWCNVCQCILPVTREGRVTKAVQKQHDQGAMHQAEERSLMYAQMGEWQLTPRRLKLHYQQYTQPRRAARLAIALGVLATRLRARHGSMRAARASWAEAAEEPGPTKEALAWREMQTTVSVANHELLRLLFEELGLLD